MSNFRYSLIHPRSAELRLGEGEIVVVLHAVRDVEKAYCRDGLVESYVTAGVDEQSVARAFKAVPCFGRFPRVRLVAVYGAPIEQAGYVERFLLPHQHAVFKGIEMDEEVAVVAAGGAADIPPCAAAAFDRAHHLLESRAAVYYLAQSAEDRAFAQLKLDG